METVEIGNSGGRTTRLGFGCSSVMGSQGRSQSLRMLESAFEAGIRHFDVAPLYGYGEAEACVGEFLKRHPEATVTTKFGLEPPMQGALKSLARSILRPVVNALPGVRAKLSGAAAKAASKQVGPAPAPQGPRVSRADAYTPEKAQASLERSFKALQRDHIDLWLMHEVVASDLPPAGSAASEALLRVLEDAVTSGKVGRFGVGSEREMIPALIAQHPAFCRTQQYEWSVLDPVPEPSAAFRIHHRALTDKFSSLREALAARPRTADRWATEVGADIGSAAVLAQLMMKASLISNPASIILFSSKNPHHIAANARLVEDPALDDAARRFYALVQAEGGPLFGRAAVPAEGIASEVGGG